MGTFYGINKGLLERNKQAISFIFKRKEICGRLSLPHISDKLLTKKNECSRISVVLKNIGSPTVALRPQDLRVFNFRNTQEKTLREEKWQKVF
jgi:hypothetical protein